MITKYKEKIITQWIYPEQKLTPGEFLVFIIKGELQAITFLCPCGCGTECYTPVVHKGQIHDKHTWEYEEGPTLTPSMRYLSGCKSHFNITGGKTIMHPN